MSHFPTHPRSGKHYIVAISPEAGPYEDLWNMYANAARTRPWLRLVPPNEALDMRTMGFYVDPDVVFVIFEPTKFDPWPKRSRKARVIGVYSEALGGNLLPPHLAHLERFEELAHRYDAIALHAPIAEQVMRTYFGERLELRRLPIGWCPVAMGQPSFKEPRETRLLFLGSAMPRRIEVLERLGADVPIEWPKCVYGPRALELLRHAQAYLYVAHSYCATFSTWRIWQALATGAALVAERAEDAWPLVPVKHFVALDQLDPTILRSLREEDLRACAERAYAEIGPEFIIDAVIEDYLVPLGEPTP